MSSTELYEVGEVAAIVIDCKDETGALSDPATLVVTITPDLGTVATYSYPANISQISVGRFKLLHPISVGGRHRGRAVTTGAVTPAAKRFVLSARA